MHLIKNSSLVIAAVICYLMVGSLNTLRAADTICKIIIATNDFTTSVFYPHDGPYQKAYSIEGRDYSISPNGQTLAIEAPMTSATQPDGRQIIFYDLKSQLPLRFTHAEGVSLIAGVAWSHDSTKLLLQDAYNNFLLYLYDLKSKSLQFIARSFDPSVETFEVVWSPNDQYVAFVGDREPTTTQTLDADTSALYVLDMKTLKYRALSLPKENVSWYFDSFYWVNNASVIYTSCSNDNQQCSIKQVSIDGHVLSEFEGKYSVEGYYGNNQLEVIDRSHQGSDSNGTVDLLTLDLDSKTFTFIQRFAVDWVTPYPIYYLSNDKQWLIYVNGVGQSVLKNLKTAKTTKIGQTPNSLAQTWSIDDNQLLFPMKSGFYIYDIQSATSHLALDYSNLNNVYRYNLICG